MVIYLYGAQDHNACTFCFSVLIFLDKNFSMFYLNYPLLQCFIWIFQCSYNNLFIKCMEKKILGVVDCLLWQVAQLLLLITCHWQEPQPNIFILFIYWFSYIPGMPHPTRVANSSLELAVGNFFCRTFGVFIWILDDLLHGSCKWSLVDSSYQLLLFALQFQLLTPFFLVL